MRKVTIALVCVGLALPMAAWADSTIQVSNTGGTFKVSDIGTDGSGTIGLSTITTVGEGSPLTAYELPNGTTFTGDLGKVFFSTGALVSGSIVNGGVFSSTGSVFDITAASILMKQLGQPAVRTALFAGTFSGPIDWTMTGHSGNEIIYTLTGNIVGTFYNGDPARGTVSETFYSYKGELTRGGGWIKFGTTDILTPEPGTMALFGTGLVGMLGMFRRKFLRS